MYSNDLNICVERDDSVSGDIVKNNIDSTSGPVNVLKVLVSQGKGFEFNVIRLLHECFL